MTKTWKGTIVRIGPSILMFASAAVLSITRTIEPMGTLYWGINIGGFLFYALWRYAYYRGVKEILERQFGGDWS